MMRTGRGVVVGVGFAAWVLVAWGYQGERIGDEGGLNTWQGAAPRRRRGGDEGTGRLDAAALEHPANPGTVVVRIRL